MEVGRQGGVGQERKEKTQEERNVGGLEEAFFWSFDLIRDEGSINRNGERQLT